DLGGDVLHDRALERVVDGDPPAGDRHTDRGWPLPRALAQAEVAARAGIARPFLAGVRRARDGRDLGARAVAVVEEVACGERRQRRFVASAALGLAVGGVR